MSKCEFSSDCKDLRSKCVDGLCVRNECNNLPDDVDIESLTNDDLNCMNIIDSGKYQGCYTCPNARSVGGKCTCTDCVNDTIKITEGDEVKPIDRCCSTITNDMCVDNIPNPLPKEEQVSAILSQFKSKKGMMAENFDNNFYRNENNDHLYPDNIFPGNEPKEEKERKIKKIRREAYQEDNKSHFSFVFMIIIIIVIIAIIVISVM